MISIRHFYASILLPDAIMIIHNKDPLIIPSVYKCIC